MSVPGRGKEPARGPSHDRSRAGRGETDPILCCVCSRPVAHPAWRDAWCWTDPGGQTCAAHGDCLRRLGETDLGLVDQ